MEISFSLPARPIEVPAMGPAGDNKLWRNLDDLVVLSG
jgi:hypothetical protein